MEASPADVEQVYEHLRQLAVRMHHERGAHQSVAPTSIVHEAWERLARSSRLEWESRAHFLAIAAKAMRHVLADRARRRGALKRGGDWERVSINGLATDPEGIDITDLERALCQLDAFNPRGADVVQLRFFGGLKNQEIAELRDLSLSTVEREWRLCRAWLLAKLK